MPGSQQTQTQSSTTPWKPQGDALKTAFSGATADYKAVNGTAAPADFVAGMTPEQLSTFRSMLGYSGSGASNADSAGNAGVGMLSTGADAVGGALSGLAGFDPSRAYNTDSIIAKANQYANNPAADGMVDAAMRDARNSVRDVVLPGISSNAALTGNTNSSRTGVAEGLVNRDLANKTADTSANIRGALFDKGLDLGTNEAMANNASTLDALKSRGALGGQAYTSGAGGVSQSIADRGNLFSLANAGGAGLQGADQLTLDNLLQQYQSKVSSPFDAEKQLMQIIGTNSWGSNTTGTQTTTPSAWQVAGGLLGAAGSAAKGLGGMGFMPFK